MTKEEIYEFIARQNTSLISSVDEEGYPATRALIQPVFVDSNEIYFATHTPFEHHMRSSKFCDIGS